MVSTMLLGVHGGKVHPEIVPWLPRTKNSPSRPFIKVLRKKAHGGQQRFDTPITGPKPYYHKKTKRGSDDRNKQERGYSTFIFDNIFISLYLLSPGGMSWVKAGRRLARQASQWRVPLNDSFSKL